MTLVADRSGRGPFAVLLLGGLLLAALLTACQPPAPAPLALSGETMGTTWSVKLAQAPASLDLVLLRQHIEARLAKVNRQMSTYDPQSSLSRFNQAPAGSEQLLEEDFALVLSAALALAADSDGAFDPTVGPLVNLWGFGPEVSRGEAPPAAALAAARDRVGWHRLHWDGRHLRQPGAAYLDLSAIAKGFGVDALAALLQEQGLQHWLVEIGGELRGQGQRPDGQPWRVAVERPQTGGRSVEAVLPLRDMAIATSGDYRNFFQADGRRYSHTIDPRTGQPVSHGLASVSVLHPSCMWADGYATVLTVLGLEQGLAFAEQRGLAVLFIERTDTGFREVPSRAFQAYLKHEEMPR